jgi:GNAT superfamily N-acetyltransferase
VEIRAARADEAGLWTAMLRDTGLIDAPVAQEATWHALFATPGVRHWFATSAAGVLGFATTFTADDTHVLLQLGVAGGVRRQGIGRALALTALGAGPHGGVLLAEPTRTSQAFLARLGFTLVRCPPDRVAYRP